MRSAGGRHNDTTVSGKFLFDFFYIFAYNPDFYSIRGQKKAATRANMGLCGLSIFSQICRE
jgi:hypothetical protein